MSLQPIPGARLAVTGGCGFIGAHLVRRLLEGGARSVAVIDKMKYGPCPDLPPGARVVPFALGADDAGALARHLEETDAVVHLAAEKHSQQRPDPDLILSSNVIGTQALLAAAGRAGVRRVIFASSVYAYGRLHGPPMVETEVPQPRTVYGASKLAGEHLTAAAAAQSGFAWMALRYFFVYGPGQARGTGYRSVVMKNAERLRAGERPTVCGDGRQALDYVYIDDVIEATVLALVSPRSGETLNIGSGQAITVQRLIDGLAAAAGAGPERVSLAADWTAGTSRVASIARAEQVLGWRPRVALEDGLARTYAWISRPAAPSPAEPRP
jgi:UDP-glucose 4-epimerase